MPQSVPPVPTEATTVSTAQSSAAQLLQVLPQKASLEPNKGAMFDSYA